jgi:excinuclease ABC subunit C
MRRRIFWPVPNGYAVRETLALLQKIFPSASARTASTATARVPACSIRLAAVWGRAWPGLVSEEEYAQQVEYVRLFLAGKDDQVLTQLIARMEKPARRWSLKRRRAFATRFRPYAG